jgi:hypothetical protein
MATQVVNLLHYRSLNLGAVPVNLEFGQFAINAYNANNPTLPNLREVYLFVGTGGDDRVDEDGTDRSADVALASSFSGEAAQVGKGWVRFNLRSMKTSGDTMTGDLIISGARIRFETGLTGSAELILPNQTVATSPTLAGSVRYNSVTDKIEFWNGALWVSSGGSDFQINTGTPTVRSDGSSLVLGDWWWKNDTVQLYAWDGSAWKESSKSVDVQLNTAAPTARSTTGTLVVGDLWFDFLTNNLNVWDGGGWQRAGNLAGDFQEVSGGGLGSGPTVRSTADALVTGDLWFDTDTNILYYYSSGGTWTKTQKTTDIQVTSTAPTSRANTSPLQTGDIYFDAVIDTLFVWTGAAWQKVIGSPGDYQVSAAAPTLRSSGDPLIAGDQWLDTTNNVLKIWDGTSAWIKAVGGADFQIAASAPATSSAGTASKDGDFYYDSTFLQLYVYQSGAWTETGNTQDFQVSASAPGTRSNTDTLQAGDTYYDSTFSQLYVWDGAAWVETGNTQDFQVATADPTARSNTDALQVGDTYLNTAVPSYSVYDGTNWVVINAFPDFQSAAYSASGPTTRSNGTSPILFGDRWYDTTRLYTLFWDGANWIRESNRIDFQTNTGAPVPSLRGNGIDPLEDGDQWFDSSGPSLLFWDGVNGVWINVNSLV